MAHLSKKELKTPDRIWIASKNLLDWATGQWVLIGIALGIVFIAIIGTSVYLNLSSKAEGEAQFHYAKAKSLFEQAQIGSGTEKADVKVELQKALEDLSKNYSSSKANKLADLMRARLSLIDKKYDEAIVFLEKYKAGLPRSKKDLALFPLATTYEDAGQFEKALSVYKEISQNEKSSFRAEAMLGKARAERNLQKYADAKATYSLFLEKFPQSLEVSAVRGLMAQLPATP